LKELTELSKLVPLEGATGAYCDPITGECYMPESHEKTSTVMPDPVCGMEVDISSAKYKQNYQGQDYVFCSASCLQAFEKEPDKYLVEGAA